ncbi:hypothetical protein EV715DRAFT_290318 [Schizophyllum commune]
MSTHCPTGLPTHSTASIKEQIKAISVEMAILGFHGALFLMSAYLLVLKGLRTSLARRYLLLMTTLMFTISIASVVCATDFYARSIDNYSLDDLPVDRALMLRESLTSNFGLRINLLLSDIIVVWRAWVLWPDTLWARLIMAVALFGSVGGVIVSSIFLFLAKLTDVAFLDWLNTSPILTVPLFFTNIVACVMVAIKVWDYRQNVKAYIGNAGNHGASIERTLLLILESGVVYCLLWLSLLLSGVEVLSDDSNTVLLSVAVSVAGLYPTIIIILVALEKSHTDTVFHPSSSPTESHSLEPLAFMATVPKDSFTASAPKGSVSMGDDYRDIESRFVSNQAQDISKSDAQLMAHSDEQVTSKSDLPYRISRVDSRSVHSIIYDGSRRSSSMSSAERLA